jgi:hypothetical protein
MKYPGSVDIRDVILTVVTAVPLTGCPSTWNCRPGEETFDLDQPVTVADLDRLVESEVAANREAIDCEDVCRQAYEDDRGWLVGDIAACSWSIPAGEGESEQPGRVACSGDGYEYACKGRRPIGHVEDGDRTCRRPVGRALAASA